MFSASVLSALLAIPFVAQAVLANQDDCTRTYTVKNGDVCDSISASEHVSTFQLAAVNLGIINPECSNLYEGETLCLGHDGEDCTDTYVVVNGDTCEGVSSKTGAPLDILYVNNPQIDDDCSNIYIGEVLCVAKTPTVPDVPDDNDVDIHRHGPWANDGGNRHHHGGDDDDDDCEEEEEEEECEEEEEEEECEEEEEEECEEEEEEEECEEEEEEEEEEDDDDDDDNDDDDDDDDDNNDVL